MVKTERNAKRTSGIIYEIELLQLTQYPQRIMYMAKKQSNPVEFGLLLFM